VRGFVLSEWLGDALAFRGRRVIGHRDEVVHDFAREPDAEVMLVRAVEGAAAGSTALPARSTSATHPPERRAP
jgi:hypothetical protein